MRKGIAVRFIILILLGIAALGVVGYWFFIVGGKGGSATQEQLCRQKALSYCQTWQAAGWPTDHPSGQDFSNPSCGSTSGTYAPECCNVAPFQDWDDYQDVTDTDCQNLV